MLTSLTELVVCNSVLGAKCGLVFKLQRCVASFGNVGVGEMHICVEYLQFNVCKFSGKSAVTISTFAI